MQRKDIYWIGYRCVFKKTKTLFTIFLKKYNKLRKISKQLSMDNWQIFELRFFS